MKIESNTKTKPLCILFLAKGKRRTRRNRRVYNKEEENPTYVRIPLDQIRTRVHEMSGSTDHDLWVR